MYLARSKQSMSLQIRKPTFFQPQINFSLRLRQRSYYTPISGKSRAHLQKTNTKRESESIAALNKNIGTPWEHSSWLIWFWNWSANGISSAKSLVAATNQLQEVSKVSGISKFSHSPKSWLLLVKLLIDWVLFVAAMFVFFNLHTRWVWDDSLPAEKPSSLSHGSCFDWLSYTGVSMALCLVQLYY